MMVAHLPDVADLAGAGWGSDLVPAARRLFDAEVHGLLRVGDGVALAFRHDDVRALAADPDVGNTPAELLMAGRSTEDGFGPILVNQMFVYNPPLHPEIRRIATRQMTPGTMARFGAAADAVVDELLDELHLRDTFDVVSDYAERVATRFWGRLFGFTPNEIVEIQRCNTALSTIFLSSMTPEQSAALHDAVQRYMAIVTNAVVGAIDGTRTCAEPGRELLFDMAADLESVVSGGGPRDIGHFVAGNFFDAFHTVGVGLASAIALLLQHPTAHRRVAADPTLAMKAYDESTRLAPPLTLTYRTMLCDKEYDGVELPEGTMIGMHWAAANIDPRAFESPLEYDLDRGQRGLLTFGAGPHLCPGRNAARFVGEIALRHLVERLPDLELDGEPRWIPCSSSAQLATCPVRGTAGGPAVSGAPAAG